MNNRNQRRVRTPRPIYGRQQAVTNRIKRGKLTPKMSLGILPKRLIVLAVMVLVVAYALKLFFTIKDVKVISPSRNAEITKEVQDLTVKRWTQSTIVTLNQTKLAADLKSADPLVKSAVISVGWPNSVTVRITLKQPSLGWTTGNQSYLLDHDGTVIGALPTGQGLSVVLDNSNLPVQLGQRVASMQFVEFTTQAATAMARLKIAPTKLEIKDTTLDLYATTPAGYQLIFDTSRSVTDEVADLQTILATLADQKKIPTQYVDLRVAGRAYYK